MPPTPDHLVTRLPEEKRMESGTYSALYVTLPRRGMNAGCGDAAQG